MASNTRKPAAKRKRGEEPPVESEDEVETTWTMESAMSEIARLRTALQQTQDSYSTLQTLRQTEPEKQLDSLLSKVEQRKLASDSMLKESRDEIERLRKHTALWRSGVDVMDEVDKREQECERLKEEVRGLKKEVVMRDEMVKNALDKQQKAESEVLQLEKALKFETEQSKIAAAQLQANPSSRIPVTAKSDQSSSNDTERYQLVSDLTGITVQRITNTEEGKQYDCLLVDASKKRGLAMAFSLVMHPDGQITYSPKLDEDRDKDLLEVLMHPYNGIMLFKSNQLGKFHRKLWQVLLQ